VNADEFRVAPAERRRELQAMRRLLIAKRV
jgi:hypothetical protein